MLESVPMHSTLNCEDDYSCDAKIEERENNSKNSFIPKAFSTFEGVECGSLVTLPCLMIIEV